MAAFTKLSITIIFIHKFHSMLILLILFVFFSGLCLSLEDQKKQSYNTYTVSSFSYPESRVRPYDVRYIRVDVPPLFSSMSINLKSDVDLDMLSIDQAAKSTLPIICFRDGSLPLPDASNTSLNSLVLGNLSNGSLERLQGLQKIEQCYPMQRNISMVLTSEQISPGAWYFGLFNGIGATRTQSKMIVRGSSYSFSANVSVEGCTAFMMWGQYCNQTMDSLLCSYSDNVNHTENLPGLTYNLTTESLVLCNSSFMGCLADKEQKLYSLNVVGIVEELIIAATNISLSPISSKISSNDSGVNLMCYVRRGAIPSPGIHDYSILLDKQPLVVRAPKIGQWFISIVPTNITEGQGDGQSSKMKVCYSLQSLIIECPPGRAGPNCLWNIYVLRTILRIFVPFESYYLPVSEKTSSDSASFSLKPLLSNFSSSESNDIWTYFLMDLPHGAAGGNIHVRLTQFTKLNYEIYARFGGPPSLYNWDYYYANRTSSSEGSMFFMLNNSTDDKIDFYILYAQEGTWGFGVKYLNTTDTTPDDQTTMSISLERCPRRCSSHGSCKTAFDASGLTSYSYCSCDRTHGGFDCSIEIVSHQGHVLQSVFLIASNAAAIFPGYWALRQKAFAEWVLFTSSGISSGLYHACDVGTWCALSFGVLQFMDFWLSFMAVVSTFVYLTTIDEVHKRTIHTAVAILTALMAITKATRSSNIILVMAIGALGLLIGWLIELSTRYRSFSFSMVLSLSIIERWQIIREWLGNLVKTLIRRFRWGFLIAGFLTLSMAGISWKLETSESYWIWHSIWHITIYTSSFLFLCSKATLSSDTQRQPDGNYELTRQDSLPRGVDTT